MNQELGPTGLALGGREQARGRLLVVEDDSIFRILLREVLQANAWSFRFARSLSEAAVQLAVWRPHLVLTDLHLPDGQAGEAIRMLLAGGAPSVVAMTGAPETPDARAALAAGAVACLAKDDLEAQLPRWLGDPMHRTDLYG